MRTSRNRTKPSLTAAALLALALAAPAAPAQSLPPLRENDAIVEKLMAARIAEMIQRYCPEIGGKLFYAISEAKALKAYAEKLGYSEDEMRAFVNDETERKRVFAMARDYMEARGAVGKDPAGHCALGRQELASKSYIGSFLYLK
ncbi:MAG: DUF5333 domain-containing protein [Rhodobacteraceae bacterium]|nr:DUF5333 domain-containing protein [Paracoccaceae bacterium]